MSIPATPENECVKPADYSVPPGQSPRRVLQHLIEQTKSLLDLQAEQLAGRAILVAVSGGPDSTVLALVCAQLAESGQLPGPLLLVHLDHGQHQDSRSVCDQVAQLAQRLGLGFDHSRLELEKNANELSMREARYDGLRKMAERHDAGLVLTAHHADDDLETILFRLLRGTGLRGLCGIPELRRLDTRVMLARPFLSTRKRYLMAALKAANVGFWQDPSNLDLSRDRNYLRHRLIPDLRAKMGTRLDVSLVAIARSARAVEKMVSCHADQFLSSRGKSVAPWRFELSLAGLDSTHRPFLGEALRQLYIQMSSSAPSSHWLHRAEGMLSVATGQRLSAGGDILLERTRNGLLVLDLDRSGCPPEDPIALPIGPQSGPQSLRFGSTEWEISARRLPTPPLDPSPRACGRFRALLDARSIQGRLTLRRRRPLDRFWPLGATSPVNLKRFLQGRHVPRFDRDRLPLLLDEGGRILWAPGVEIAENVKIRPDSGPCIEVRAKLLG